MKNVEQIAREIKSIEVGGNKDVLGDRIHFDFYIAAAIISELRELKEEIKNLQNVRNTIQKTSPQRFK